MGEREKIPNDAIFSNGVVRVQKDVVFGWVILLKDDGQTEEEAYGFDEIDDEIFAILQRNAQEEAFPEELREYLREFETKRSNASRMRTVH